MAGAEPVELLASVSIRPVPEPGGRQPRNRHDVFDPLLLAPQKERTSNLLWVFVFLLLTLANWRRLWTKIGNRSSPAGRPPHEKAVAATTCRSQWRRDARDLGPSNTLRRDATHTDMIVLPSCSSKEAVSLGCQPGSYESAYLVAWSVLGRRPFARSTIARWQEATDPQSPEGRWSAGLLHEGAHPTASGRHGTVALIKQTALLWIGSWEAVSSGCQPGVGVVPFNALVGALLQLSYSVGATDKRTSSELDCGKTPPVRDDSGLKAI